MKRMLLGALVSIALLLDFAGHGVHLAEASENPKSDFQAPFLLGDVLEISYVSIKSFSKDLLIADTGASFRFIDKKTGNFVSQPLECPYGKLAQIEDGWCVIQREIRPQGNTLNEYIIFPNGKRYISYDNLLFLNPDGIRVSANHPYVTCYSDDGVLWKTQIKLLYASYNRIEPVHFVGHYVVVGSIHVYYFFDICTGKQEFSVTGIYYLGKNIQHTATHALIAYTVVDLLNPHILFRIPESYRDLKLRDKDVLAIKKSNVNDEWFFDLCRFDFSGNIKEQKKLVSFKAEARYQGNIKVAEESDFFCICSNFDITFIKPQIFVITNPWMPDETHKYVLTAEETTFNDVFSDNECLYFRTNSCLACFRVEEKIMLWVKPIQYGFFYSNGFVTQEYRKNLDEQHMISTFSVDDPSAITYASFDYSQTLTYCISDNNKIIVFPKSVSQFQRWPLMFSGSDNPVALGQCEFAGTLQWGWSNGDKSLAVLKEENGNIYFMELVNGKWSIKKPLEDSVNPKVICSDGETLFYEMKDTLYLINLSDYKVILESKLGNPQRAFFFKDKAIIHEGYASEIWSKSGDMTKIEGSYSWQDEDYAYFISTNSILIFDGNSVVSVPSKNMKNINRGDRFFAAKGYFFINQEVYDSNGYPLQSLGNAEIEHADYKILTSKNIVYKIAGAAGGSPVQLFPCSSFEVSQQRVTTENVVIFEFTSLGDINFSAQISLMPLDEKSLISPFDPKMIKVGPLTTSIKQKVSFNIKDNDIKYALIIEGNGLLYMKNTKIPGFIVNPNYDGYYVTSHDTGKSSSIVILVEPLRP